MSLSNFTAESLSVTPNGELLKDLRSRQQETQRQVEDVTKISSPRLSLYESGNPISLCHLKLLAEHYGVSVAALTHPNDADRMRRMSHELRILFPPKNGVPE